jgi:hypothetical protein
MGWRAIPEDPGLVDLKERSCGGCIRSGGRRCWMEGKLVRAVVRCERAERVELAIRYVIWRM